MIRPAVLVLATLMAGPAIWSALVTQTLDVQSALLRFLIAVPIAAVMLALLRIIVESYRRPHFLAKPPTDPGTPSAPAPPPAT